MRCDKAGASADARDASVINGIFSAGLILHTHLNQIDNGKAACYVEGALDELDEALREIRWAAFVRTDATPSPNGGGSAPVCGR